MILIEAQLDGLVGNTHNYAGLSFGNVASEKNAHAVSSPKKAALQGLAKMKFVSDLGILQLVMPPQIRPDIVTMQSLGYTSLQAVPETLLAALGSASSMWVANAATITPSADSDDGKLHITPANLVNKFHRSIEANTTAHYLRSILSCPDMEHHAPLPAHTLFSDEGAANHMRLYNAQGDVLNIFVYGGNTQKYPARQSRIASEAVARLHRLKPEQVLFLEQSLIAIDAGVFHNDVIAMSYGDVCIYHEHAFLDDTAIIASPFRTIKISEKELSLQDAVQTYFFNSQLLTLPSGGCVVIAPSECEEHPAACAVFDRLVNENIFEKVYYLDVRESMKNGGGPACLRLRVPLTTAQLKVVNVNTILNNVLYNKLHRWVEIHYRDTLRVEDLRDPQLYKELQAALSELYAILGITMRMA